MAGLETRANVLPTPEVPQGPGVLGPDYSFPENVKLPGEIGVRTGDDIRDVIDAVRGVGYYVDTIGFGEPSSFMTQGMGLKPMGINFWMKTGFKCSNGADMWSYVEGIPKGDALGERVDAGLQSAGLPRLRGLAPGILEDTKAALNPVPILETVFGSGYPQCRFVKKPVGDQDGRIQNPSSGKYYVENPETVVNGEQGRWVFEKGLTRAEFDQTPKTFCPDGYPIRNHRNNDCSDRLESLSIEGFQNDIGKLNRQILFGIAVLGSLIVLKGISKRC